MSIDVKPVVYFLVFRKAFVGWQAKAKVYKSLETAQKYCGKHSRIVSVNLSTGASTLEPAQ